MDAFSEFYTVLDLVEVLPSPGGQNPDPAYRSVAPSVPVTITPTRSTSPIVSLRALYTARDMSSAVRSSLALCCAPRSMQVCFGYR